MSAARDVEQRAAQWLVQREQPDWSIEDADALDRWLAESTAHKAALWRLEAGWNAAERLAATRVPVVAPAYYRPSLVMRLAIAASLSLVACLSIFLIQRPSAPDAAALRFATEIGDRREVMLDDGSKVTLNTASVLRASVTRSSRDVWLDKGEAYFEVAHDARHPFVILAGNQKVTVLGTHFSVRRDGATVLVAVTEGRVRVENADDTSGRAAIVTAGDVAVAHGSSILLGARSPERIADTLSWREGVLTFDQVTLADAADEFNRYNRAQIRFGDSKAGQTRIGGSFEATDVEAFTRLLHSAFGLTIAHSGDTITISS